MRKQNNLSFEINVSWVYLAGFFLVLALPLLIFNPLFTPIGWGKTLVFRVIISLMLVIFFWHVFSRKIELSEILSKLKTVSLPFWFLVAYLFVSAISVFASFDPNFSFWGSPARSGGFANIIFYATFGLLVFFLAVSKDWKKIFNFSVFIGVIVSLVAVIQQFGLFDKYFLTFSYRPVSTLGNPIYVAIYLNFLIFISLLLLIRANRTGFKIFYGVLMVLFAGISIIFTQTRSAFLAMIIAGLWFFFSYPKPALKKIKIWLAIIAVFVFFLMVYVDANFNRIFGGAPFIVRSSIGRAISIVENPTNIINSRISTWKISAAALKERPLLGYGPENFMIAFDKFYDPALPRIGATDVEQEFQWWDRAHNFLLDVSVTSGIPALLAYLGFYISIFWLLQKSKRERPELLPEITGAQSMLIAYLFALLFLFDFFESYVLSFMIIGYSFFLIWRANAVNSQNPNMPKIENFSLKLYRNRIVLLIIFLLAAGLFIFKFNIEPIRATKQLNTAYDYTTLNNCKKALTALQLIPNSENIVSDYIREMSVQVIQDCAQTISDPASNINLITEAERLLNKNVANNPYHLRYWMLLGEDSNYLIEMNLKKSDNFFGSKEMDDLKAEAYEYFTQASILSPKRQQIYIDWAKTDIITGDYLSAQQKAQKCIDLNPNYGECYWLMALIHKYLGNNEQYLLYIDRAVKNGVNIESTDSLSQLLNVYIKKSDYQSLIEIYPKMISLTEDKAKKAQLYAALAVSYREVGNKKAAKEAALKALELFPQAKPTVDEFLKTL